MPEPMAKNVSSSELHSQVESFMERAEKVFDHSLADSRAPFNLTSSIDLATEQLIRVDLDHNDLPEASWTYLALLERPIVFVRQTQSASED